MGTLFFHRVSDVSGNHRIWTAPGHCRSHELHRKMIPKFRGTPGIVQMVGDSTGAFLTLYTAAIQRNPTLAKASGVRPSYLEIQSMALISGMFYTTGKDSIGMFLPKALYGESDKKHSFYPYLDPSVPAVGLSLPPCLLITSKRDKLYGYTRDLSQALQRCGTPHTLKNYGDDPNLYHAFFVVEPELPESRMVTSFPVSNRTRMLLEFSFTIVSSNPFLY